MVDVDKAILARLETQEKEGGTLPRLLDFYRHILSIQSAVKDNTGAFSPSLTRDTVQKRNNEGLPALRFDELALDWPLVANLFTRVALAFAEYPELFGAIPDRLNGEQSGRFLTREVVRNWFDGDKLPPLATGESIDENLLRTIIQATLRPFLLSYSRALYGLIDQERWYRRCCPVCGGAPDFAFLDKERGARWLVCSRCDAEWRFQRLECPYCGNQDQNSLAYFADDEGLYRLYVCERCKGYLKAIDLRQAKDDALLPLERVLTSEMDRQAREKGYSLSG
jgi:FdhE protein